MTSYLQLIKDAAGSPQPPADAPRSPVAASQQHADLHPYAAAAVAAELDRLDRLPRPWSPGSYWDTTTFEVACNLLELANSTWSGYSLTDAEADLRAHAPRDDRWGERQHEKCWKSAETKVAGAGRPEPAAGELPPVTVLDVPADEIDAFWNARKLLTHLHTFARARRVSPWAVLGVALARIVTATPWALSLPPIIGGRASINLFVGLVGASGDGKGAAEAVAADALAMRYIEIQTAGSGEGIAHGYVQRVKGEVEWRDDEHAVLFSIAEIDTLAALGARKGATLMPELRRAWSGERLGFGYADPAKRLPVPAHQYRMAIVAGIQPARAGCLLDDTDGGTPQRWIWLPAADPEAPTVAPTEPAPWQWTCPPLGHVRNAHGGIDMKVCQVARDTITAARLDRLRGNGHALDGHALLARLKVAAALALADERLEVNEEDWALSEVIARQSDATRHHVASELHRKVREAGFARADAEAERAVVVSERLADNAVKRVCQTVARRLEKVTEGDGWAPRKVLTQAVQSRDRGHLDEALTRLLEAGQIEEQEASRGFRYRITGGAR